MTYNKEIKISTGESRAATQWKQYVVLWSDFCNMFQSPPRGNETLAEYKAKPKSEQDALKDVGGYVGGLLNSPRRKKENVTERSLITLDFDNIPCGGMDGFIQKIRGLGFNWLMHTTRKHTKETPRGRLIIPLDRNITPDEYAPLARLIAFRIDMTWADPTTFDIARLMYYPSLCSDSDYICEIEDKPFLRADDWLNYHTILMGDWHDPMNWAKMPNVPDDYPKALAKKQGDPLEKEGIVGNFCRVYDIHRAIDTLIPGIYTSASDDDSRYTFIGGSTTGGAVVYDDGKFLFSHHATDPCSGKLVNAFDLVRLHKFGAKDDTAAPGTPVGRLPSYTAMKEYIQTLPDVHIEAATAAADFAGLESAAVGNDAWKQRLDISQAGKLKSTLNNITLILENDSRFVGRLRKDLFHDRIDAEKLPWERSVKPWDDTDSRNLRLWMERAVDGKVSDNDVIAAVDMTADKKAYHPVKNYLERLVWDGTPRLDTALSDYLGAADNAYTRAVSRKSFAAAVARIMSPGIKFDCMTVLVGSQGRGKSTFLSIMGGDWFSDSLRTFEGKEAEERLRGVWIIEISELQGFERSSVEAIKGFLSKQTDRYRPAYGHMLREFPRQCVFFGTTNAHDCLRDTTGGRRFWPVDIDEQLRTKSVWDDLTRERDQLWAEAVAYYNAGESLFLSGDVEREALQIQEDHREVDAWEGMLLDFIAKPIPADWDDWPLDRRRDYLAGQANTGDITLVERERISATEFMCEALHYAPSQLKKQDIMRVGQILRGLQGWKPCRYRIPYAQARGYVRIK